MTSLILKGEATGWTIVDVVFNSFGTLDFANFLNQELALTFLLT